MAGPDLLTQAGSLPGEFERPLRATAEARGPFGARVFYLPETASTNDVAARLADGGLPEGTMVLAEAQTSGRGRLGREWFSPPGAGLYVSLVLRDPRLAPVVTLAAGVAVADGIRRATGLPALLKWPNDLVVADDGAPGGHRKLAGILAEACTAGGVLQYVILGLGVNVRQASYPAALGARTASIEAELGRSVDAGALLAQILVALNETLPRAAADRVPVLRRWSDLSPSARGRRVEWTAGGEVRRGVTAGIAPDGALLVSTSAGTERIVSGEVTWS